MVRKNKDPSGIRGKDRISELPEPLIHLILSFLPTECVVSMSVLSKRWRYIWTSVPVIDLRGLKYVTSPPLEDPNEEHERSQIYPVQLQRIISFVDKKLSLHHETRDIKKFYLDCCDVFDPSERLEQWVSALFTRHNLEEFVVCRDVSECLTGIGIFPSFGTCASLVILELDIWDEVRLPGAINFPNLKICRIRNAELHLLELTNLPVLEELELTNILWDVPDILLISAPALKYLSITGPNDSTEFDDSPFYEFKIKILAPNLLSVRYADVPPEDFILHRFESLVDAQIDFDRFERPLPQGKDAIATKVLEKLSNVKRLEISGETFEELLLPDGLLTNLPMFHNLVYLKVTSKITFSKDTTLFNFLTFSPNLVRIHIAQGYVKHLSSTDSGSRPDMVPQCMLLHLKLVKFCLFDGWLEERNAVKTFLKNARVLQRMIIKFRPCISTVTQNKVMKKLLKFPRGSNSCTIEVS